MRPRSVMMPLAVGLAGYAWLRHRRKRPVSRRQRHVARERDTASAARFASRARTDPRFGGVSFAADPADPVQRLHEAADLEVMPLEVDVLSQADVEAAQDLASLEAELEDEPGREPGLEVTGDGEVRVTDVAADGDGDVDGDVIELTHRKVPGTGDAVAPAVPARDAGDLYGAHTPAAADRVHPEDDRAFDEGQNWLEALETSAAENGPEPEHEVESAEDEDVLSPPHASDTRDVPVADHGAGGRRGL